MWTTLNISLFLQLKFVCHFCKETTIENDQISKLINEYQSTFKVTIVKRTLPLFKLRVSWNYVCGPLYDCLYACLIVWVFFFVSNKRQKGRTDRTKFCGGPHITPGKVYESLKLEKKIPEKYWIFLKMC